MQTKEFDIAVERVPANWRDYYALTKPGVLALLVFTAIVGMLLARPGVVTWRILLFASLGIGLASACAAALNHILDQRLDAKMSRTRRRPLPMGRIEERDAVLTQYFQRGVLDCEERDGKTRIADPSNGACRFVTATGCSIHDVKPLQCRTFPYWPEYVGSKGSWKNLRQFCPGIGVGVIVPVKEIRSQAQATRDAFAEP